MKISLKKLLALTLVLPAAFLAVSLVHQPKAAAYNSAYLISDKLFTDTSTMTATDVQNFLVSKNSGLKNYHDIEDCGNVAGAHYAYYATYYSCGQSVLASKIIYDAAQAYGINPRSILATIQKEQSLITNPSPSQAEINCAMGYYSCTGFSGFFLQVDNGSWQFRTYIELMSNRNYWGYTPSSYPCKNPSSLYTPGLYPGNDVTFIDHEGHPYTHFVIANSSTAGLYCYTPHAYPGSSTHYYSGSYWFDYYFELWFGSVASPCYNDNNVPATLSGRRVLKNKTGARTDNLALNFLNNTGSACVEIHTWGPNQQAWISNIATNHPVVNSDDQVISADYNGDGRSEFYLVKYRNTGSGRLEVHGWDSTNQHWAVNIATNHPEVNPADDEVISGDTNGDGKDELIFIKYRNTGSGRIEIHNWGPGLQSWTSNIATNHPEVDPANERVIAADTNGDGKDELILVKYQGGASGRIEVHTWNPGYQSWMSNIATNHPAVNPADNIVLGADTVGDGKDRLILVKYYGGASGRIEVHTWNPGYQSWMSNIATNHPAVNW